MLYSARHRAGRAALGRAASVLANVGERSVVQLLLRAAVFTFTVNDPATMITFAVLGQSAC